MQENTINNCTPKLDILHEMDKFLKTQKLPKLIQEEMQKQNSSLRGKEIKSILKSLPTKKRTIPDGFIGNFHQIFKEEITQFSSNSSKL